MIEKYASPTHNLHVKGNYIAVTSPLMVAVEKTDFQFPDSWKELPITAARLLANAKAVKSKDNAVMVKTDTGGFKLRLADAGDFGKDVEIVLNANNTMELSQDFARALKTALVTTGKDLAGSGADLVRVNKSFIESGTYFFVTHIKIDTGLSDVYLSNMVSSVVDDLKDAEVAETEQFVVFRFGNAVVAYRKVVPDAFAPVQQVIKFEKSDVLGKVSGFVLPAYVVEAAEFVFSATEKKRLNVEVDGNVCTVTASGSHGKYKETYKIDGKGKAKFAINLNYAAPITEQPAGALVQCKEKVILKTGNVIRAVALIGGE